VGSTVIVGYGNYLGTSAAAIEQALVR